MKLSSADKQNTTSKTILVITVGFLVLFILFKKEALLYISLAIGLVGILSSFLAEKIEWAWNKLSWLLSLVIPKIVLGIVFFLILTPIALLSRLLNRKDKLMLKKGVYSSTFSSVDKQFDSASMDNPW